MKSLKEIKKQLEKNRANIESMTAEIMRLDYTEERRQATQGNGIFNNQTWKEYYEAAKANADRIAELSNKIYIAEVATRILRENARCALIAEATPVILKACEKYDGKPYGEKTAEKIRAEVRAAGYGFYFEGYKNSRLVIYQLNAQGYKSHADEATAAAYDEAGHIASFLTEENKLNIANVIIKPHTDKYTENPTKAAAEVANAIKKYSEATKELERQRRALCDILPDGIKEPEYIKEYYIRF